MNLATFYEQMKVERNPYIDYADQIAQLIHPTINPRGEHITSSGGVSQGDAGSRAMIPDSHKGTQALSSLSSTTVKTMMPHGVKYGSLDFPQAVWDVLGPNGTDIVRGRMERRATSMINALEHKNAAPLMISALERNLIEGSTAVINWADGLQFIPLRGHVVHRVSGLERTIIIEEELVADPTERKDGDAAKRRYIMVRRSHPRVNGESGVWIQEGVEGPAQKWDELAPEQVFVMVSSLPDIDNYPVSYTYRYFRLFERINHAEARLNDAMGIASFNVPLIRPGSELSKNLHLFKERKSGEPFVADPNDIAWFNSEMKMGDWGFVAQLLQHYYQNVAEGFAMGIKDRQIGADASATAVIQMIDELNTQTQGILTAIEHTCIRQLLWSEFWIQERESPLFADLITDSNVYANVLNTMEIVITTGANAAEKQRGLMRFALQILPMLVQLDQRLKPHGKNIADKFSDSMMVDMDGTYEHVDEQPTGGVMPSVGGVPEDGQAMMTAGGPQRSDNPQPAAGIA